MPQMSPMFWIVFPLMMMTLMVVSAVVMSFESLVEGMEEKWWNSGVKMEW